MEGRKRIISILGDSISTYSGITPEGFVYYGDWNAVETGVASTEDTWWMKVIHSLDGVLGSNNSLAGSLVAGRALSSGTSPERIKDLASGGSPDMILVAMGANDWGFCVLPEEFDTEYRRMLHLIKYTYPNAEIWCATIPEGKAPEDEISFFDVDSCISKRIYCNIIKEAAAENGLRVADLYSYNKEYTTVDGVHPDREGMNTLADMWISELKQR